MPTFKAILFSFFLISAFIPHLEANQNETVIADFNSGEAKNNLGQIIEVWLQGDGSDTTQTCKMSFAQDDALANAAGQSLAVDYDVDSENPAYNGVRMDLGGFDASEFKTLSFYIRGDSAKGYPKNFKIELIGPNQRPSPYIVSNITDSWQKISIPLTEFLAVNNWKELQKFVVVFADIVSTPKVGTVYLDQIAFSKE